MVRNCVRMFKKEQSNVLDVAQSGPFPVVDNGFEKKVEEKV